MFHKQTNLFHKVIKYTDVDEKTWETSAHSVMEVVNTVLGFAPDCEFVLFFIGCDKNHDGSWEYLDAKKVILGAPDKDGRSTLLYTVG